MSAEPYDPPVDPGAPPMRRVPGRVVRLGGEFPLAEATPQEMQCELLRRGSFNGLDGPALARSLLTHRGLWFSFTWERVPLPAEYAELAPMSMIVHRDLPHGVWNADTLRVLCPDAAAAKALAAVAEDEDWGGEAWLVDDREAVDGACGTGRCEWAVLQVWWD